MTPQAKLEIVTERLRSSTCIVEAMRARFFDQVVTKDGLVEREDDQRHLDWLDQQIAENKAAINIQVQRRKVVGS